MTQTNLSQAKSVHQANPDIYVCYSCNKELKGRICMPRHNLYRVKSFWRGFIEAVVGLVLYQLVVRFLAYLLGMTLVGFGIGGAGLLLAGYLIAALTQSLRGGAARLLVPQFLGIAAGAGLLIAFNVMLVLRA